MFVQTVGNSRSGREVIPAKNFTVYMMLTFIKKMPSIDVYQFLTICFKRHYEVGSTDILNAEHPFEILPAWFFAGTW